MTDELQASSSDIPAWVHDAIFYQIFPDRFARSQHDEKPSCLLPWAAAPTSHGYHGGDLWGVIEHLDYLAELGINAIYMTPIFQSASNHRYHTHDYEKIDPLLGGEQALRALVDQAHQRGIRIVLDGVFNHASRGFLPFHDILENGPDSPWLEWFGIGDWPLAPYDESRPANYDCWLGNRALPKFNTDHPPVREYLMQIGERWVREFDIDGWRLDVPDEITTPGFWEEFRQRVRAIKPETYLVGEIWEDAPDWLQGDRFDATMNYQLTAAIIAFMAGDRVDPVLVSNRTYDPCPAIDAREFAQQIDRLLNLYPWQVTKSQLNLLDSHDTPRLLSLARGDKATVRLATLFQMTFPGAPCIYYGDEIALRGTDQYDQPHEDQDARWPFPWHDRSLWDMDLLAFFRETIALRHAHPVLRHGRCDTLWAEDHALVSVRSDGDQTLVVAINAGQREAELHLAASGCPGAGTTLNPLFGTAKKQSLEAGHWNLRLPARSGAVWVRS